MRRYLSLIQKGNGGKDNPVLSVVPQGDRFSASSISARIMKHNTVTKLERGEFLLILLSVKDESSQRILVGRKSITSVSIHKGHPSKAKMS